MNKDEVKKLWKEHWLLKMIRHTLPKDQTGRLKGEFFIDSGLMGKLFYKTKEGLVKQVRMRKRKSEEL